MLLGRVLGDGSIGSQRYSLCGVRFMNTMVKMYGLRAYVWSAVDVDTGNIRLTGQEHINRFEVP